MAHLKRRTPQEVYDWMSREWFMDAPTVGLFCEAAKDLIMGI